MGRFS